MQLVRCEQCGAKALIAASQCPRCAHAFFLRGSRGQTVPLGHCSVCDTYYPRRLGGCHWCGTKVSTFPTGLVKLVIGLVAAASVVAVGVWQYRVRTRPDEQAAAQEARATMSVPPVLAAQVTPLVDSVTIGLPITDSLASVASVAAATLSASVESNARDSVASAGTVVPPVTRQPSAPYAGPWARAVAHSWVNVRASASLSATVVGVVTPNTRVQLGDSRGAWRRVRSAGFEGWADGAFFDSDSAGR
ncbi:MAG: SH3 domain-containing protein [Gemmatimonadota bacterium]